MIKKKNIGKNNIYTLHFIVDKYVGKKGTYTRKQYDKQLELNLRNKKPKLSKIIKRIK